MAYQTFDERDGDLQSAQKLSRIRLPKDLKGMRVLDLGCNEGFFCLEAKRRGAEYVKGLDHDPRAIQAASNRAKSAGLDIDFEVQNMTDPVDDGPFDIILFLSALHYIERPAELLRKIYDVLSPTGLLILETGISSWSSSLSVGRALRSIDERYFPTEALLRNVWLRDYVIRDAGPSVAQAGDPVPRHVYHCRRASKTNVLLITGKGGIGKTVLSLQIGNVPVISTDRLFAPARAGTPRLSPAQKSYEDVFKSTQSIWATWEIIEEKDEVKSYFASVIADAIRHCAGNGLVVVEGFVLESLVPLIEKNLGPSFQCWQASKVT